VRQCPARAIAIVDGNAQILEERCVQCGACVSGCSNGGYTVRDDLQAVRDLLASERRVVAILASEYVAALHPLTSQEVERALESAGFYAVETTVLGEELVAAAYEQVHTRAQSALPKLRSTCPVTVSWVARFYPQLVDALVPVIPPYIAQARLVQSIYPAGTAIVYVSPCWARKDEVHEERFAGVVDVAIGFDELEQLLGEGSRLVPMPGSRANSSRRPQASKQLSLTDGFPRRALVERDPAAPQLVTVRGLDDLDRLLRGIMRGETAPALVDMLACEGCVDGPAIDSELSVFAKRNIVAAHREHQPPPPIDSRSFLSALPAIELRCSFEPKPALTRVPTVAEIDSVLAAGEFASRSETIDCGACGYRTCVDHAAAICLGHSTWDLCFPLQRKLMARERTELTRNALMDPLTGLGNRRQFDQRLAEEVARARRYSEPLSLAMIDLDRFKDINDQYGHVVGDTVLAAVGVLLAGSLRSADIACRYGGDEFSVILPQTSKTEAWVVAEKLRSELHELVVHSKDGTAIPVYASLGVAAYSADHESAVNLLEAADAALYRAKHGGRDRVELALG
jgi:diguanylate cyclase (GGDEF)-like protein